MPSYADEYAAFHPALQGGKSGPVRITISCGDAVRGVDGLFTHIDKWEEEEVMDVEVVTSIDEDMARSSSAQSPHEKLVDTIRSRLSAGRSSRPGECSLLVLDTNVLLSTLTLIKKLVSQCLSRNVFSLTNPTFSPSPIVLIIPHIVLSELDNLKSSQRGDVATQARAANAWILSALQTQKKQMYDAADGDIIRRQEIPERSWVLHVENTAHASAINEKFGPLCHLTPDEEIVRLCFSLHKQAGFDVFFCSDDNNARTRAEVDGIATFSFKELVSGMDKDVAKLASVANDLIEQWQAQVQGQSAQGRDVEQMDEDDFSERTRTQQEPNALAKKLPIKSDTRDAALRTLGESTHPVQSYHQHNSTARPARTVLSNTNNDATGWPQHSLRDKDIKSDKDRYVYPNDKSTASSMWAVQSGRN